jgi:UPF0176 protein
MKVASFYRFLDLGDAKTFRVELQALCEKKRLLGTILVATEGFNGTIAGDEGAILAVFRWIEERLLLDSPIDARWTDAGEAPFRRMRVRLKQEIVTLGRPDILPHERTGKYVPPEKWNVCAAREVERVDRGPQRARSRYAQSLRSGSWYVPTSDRSQDR